MKIYIFPSWSNLEPKYIEVPDKYKALIVIGYIALFSLIVRSM